MSAVWLGIDLGGTKTATALWRDGRCEGRAQWPTLSRPGDTVERITLEARRLLGGEGRALHAAGVSAGGPVDAERGILRSVPNLPGWEDVPLGSMLAEALGTSVAVENDANACALAEWSEGAGRGASSLAFLTFSTGLGCGLVLDGRLWRGARDLAGELGHVTVEPDGEPCGCGRRGCLEAYASGAGIARRLAARDLGGAGGPRSARDLVAAARSGDGASRRFLEETAGWLARGLATLLFVVDPERIVLGTIAVGAGDLLLDPLRAALRNLVWPAYLERLEVRPAALGAELGDRAASAVARALLRPGS